MLLLEFVYTGNIGHYTLAKGVGGGVVASPPPPVTWERAAALFQAADKYALDQLTLLCVPLIIDTLSPANAMPTLQMLAARPNCAGTPRLLAAVKAFWISNFDAIIPHLNPISASATAVSAAAPAGATAAGKPPAGLDAKDAPQSKTPDPATGAGATVPAASAAAAAGVSPGGAPTSPATSTAASAAVASAGGLSNVSHVSRVLAHQPRPYRTVNHESSSTTAPLPAQIAAARGREQAGAAPQQLSPNAQQQHGGGRPASASAAAQPVGAFSRHNPAGVGMGGGRGGPLGSDDDEDEDDDDDRQLQAAVLGGRADSPDSAADALNLAAAIGVPAGHIGGGGGGMGSGGDGSNNSSPSGGLAHLRGGVPGMSRSEFAQSFYAARDDVDDTPLDE